MSMLLLMNVGQHYSSATTSAGTDPQLNVWKNFQGLNQQTNAVYSNGTLSVNMFNLPVSMSLGVAALGALRSVTAATGTMTIQMALYSLSGSTLSLENSGSMSFSASTTQRSWYAVTTWSKTQNISPGQWWWGVNIISSSVSSFSFLANSSVNITNAPLIPMKGHMTVSTATPPSSIATSNLDISGNDAMRQPFIIITA